MATHLGAVDVALTVSPATQTVRIVTKMRVWFFLNPKNPNKALLQIQIYQSYNHIKHYIFKLFYLKP